MEHTIAVGPTVSDAPNAAKASAKALPHQPSVVCHCMALIVSVHSAKVISCSCPILLGEGDAMSPAIKFATDAVGTYVIHAIPLNCSVLKAKVKFANIMVAALVGVIASPGSTGH